MLVLVVRAGAVVVGVGLRNGVGGEEKLWVVLTHSETNCLQLFTSNNLAELGDRARVPSPRCSRRTVTGISADPKLIMLRLTPGPAAGTEISSRQADQRQMQGSDSR